MAGTCGGRADKLILKRYYICTFVHLFVVFSLKHLEFIVKNFVFSLIW